MKFLHKLQPNWPIFALLAIVAGIFWQNFVPGTFLTGWDNLHPEFYFQMNVKRSLFAVWQEYQGLGLLGGMGHASDLLRQLFLWGLSFIAPGDVLRYFWTFLMLFIGSWGMYFLLTVLFFKKKESRVIPFLGALFYLLNLATVQTFFVPFEAFVTHFAALPWLIASSLLYLHTPTKKHFLFLILILFLATPASYIPTLFVVFMIALSILTGIHFLFHRTKPTLITSIKLYSTIFLVNAFWLLPFLYFTATNADVNLNSKINQMATETIYLQNKEFGGILDVMLLKGFWFNNIDPNFNGIFTYMLAPWRDHLASPFILAAGYALFGIILIGLITAIKRKNPLYLSFIALFLFALTTLAITTPPFSWLNSLFREAFPLLNQAFRFPFTKFSLLTGFTYAVFFALGISGLSTFLTKYSLSPLMHKGMRIGLFLIPLLLLVSFSFPTFKGNLLYTKETIEIPDEYFALFEYFKNQDQNTRIANFPQHTFWGWNFYDWGYGGSGFLWYGIKQPMLDRAFDVWSLSDEVYYYELSQALYSKNQEAFLQVLNKYDITWLLVDNNVINPISPQALYTNELETIIEDTPQIQKATSFGEIDVYKVALTNTPRSFVTLLPQLPTVNTQTLDITDNAYKEFGDYISPVAPHLNETALNYYYLFPSLFSLKTPEEQSFTLSKSKDHIRLQNKHQAEFSDTVTLTIPRYADTETIIPATFTTRENEGSLIITLTVETPTLWYGKEQIWGQRIQEEIFTLQESSIATSPAMLDINGIVQVPIKNEEVIVRTFLSLTENNILTLTTATEPPQQREIPGSELAALSQLSEQTVTIEPQKNAHFSLLYPLLEDNYLGFSTPGAALPQATLCDPFRTNVSRLTQEPDGTSLTFFASDATACSSYYERTLLHDQGYGIFITHNNTTGRGFHFWVLNQDGKYAPIDTFLPEQKESTTTTFVLAPQESFGQAYSFHFDNSSIGQDVSINTLENVSIYPLPYRFLSSLRTTIKPFTRNQSEPDHSFTVSHPNESLYVVSEGHKTTAPTLTLSQSYDKGWKAYVTSSDSWTARFFPFVVGEELTEHVKVNNWENGWLLEDEMLTNDDHIVIVYLPQYLQYLGFILPFVILPFFLLRKDIFRLRRNA